MAVKPTEEPADIFLRLRKRIAEALRAEGIEPKPGVSGLQFAIGTFAPSEILKRFQLSDYPFIGARYVSLRDGHVYIVVDATETGDEVLAYRLGFWRSSVTHRGGMAVSISENGWMDSRMGMYSLTHASFSMGSDGGLEGIDADMSTRRSYPIKKLKAYLEWWKRKWLQGYSSLRSLLLPRLSRKR